MGIDTGIRKFMRSDATWCPDAFSTDTIPVRGCAIVYDLLTEMYRALGPRYDYTFTGEEIAAFVFDLALRPLTSGAARQVVFCADTPDWVPPEKAAEQARRDVRRDTKPYPDGLTITDQGVYRGRGHAAELMDIRRVMANRPMRTTLWKYILTTWIRSGVHMRIPNQCSVTFDHFTDGHHVFLPEGHRQLRAPGEGEQFGEADLKARYWVLHLARQGVRQILVQSIDSDFMPILVYAYGMLTKAQRPQLFLKYWRRGQVTYWCDIGKIHAHVVDKRGWDEMEFVVHCILCGSDYVNKQILFAGISCERAFRHFEEYMGMDHRPGAARHVTRTYRNFLGIVRYVYGAVWGINYTVEEAKGHQPARTKPATLQKLYARSTGRRVRVPPLTKDPKDPRGLYAIYVQVVFNTLYWTNDEFLHSIIVSDDRAMIREALSERRAHHPRARRRRRRSAPQVDGRVPSTASQEPRAQSRTLAAPPSGSRPGCASPRRAAQGGAHVSATGCKSATRKRTTDTHRRADKRPTEGAVPWRATKRARNCGPAHATSSNPPRSSWTPPATGAATTTGGTARSTPAEIGWERVTSRNKTSLLQKMRWSTADAAVA